MTPPSKFAPNYAQLYTLDEDAGFDERLRRLLLATKSGAHTPDDEEEDGGDDGEDDHAPRAPSRNETAEQRRMRSVLPTINAVMHANTLAQQYKRAFEEAKPYGVMCR